MYKRQVSTKPKQESEQVLERVKALLERMLNLDESHELVLTAAGIGIRRNQRIVNLHSLGDGYRSIITLVADMLSWCFLKDQDDGKNESRVEVEAIVLIDEVEQHLHPEWQRTVVKKLIDSFPNAQFLVTSHSPLVASGCEEVPVHKINDGVHEIVNPFGWLAEDVLRLMGLEGTRFPEIQQEFEDFKRLEKKRIAGTATKQDREDISLYRAKVEKLPATDPLRLTADIESIVARVEQLRKNKKNEKR